MILSLFHVALGLTGLLLLYVGLFLTETEEGQLQNRLADLWVRVDDLHSSAMTRQAALLQQISGLAADGLGWLFGQKLFSVKSLATCLCFAMASINISGVLFVEGDVLLMPHLKLFMVISALVLLILGVSRKLRYLGFLYFAFGWFAAITGFHSAFKVSRGEIISGAAVLSVGMILSVTVLIGVTRWSLRQASRLSNTISISGVMLLNVALGGALIGPFAFKWARHFQIVLSFSRVRTSLASRPHGFLIFLFGVAEMNLFTAAVAFTIVAALFAALAHRLVWPVISRPVYALHRYGVIKQHKLLVALGSACLVFAWPNNIVSKTIAAALHAGG